MAPKTPESVLEGLVKKLEGLVEGKAGLGIELGAVFGPDQSMDEAMAQAEAFSLAIEETNKQITRQSNKVGDLAGVLKGDLGKRLGLTRKQFAAISKDIKLVAADLEKTTHAAGSFGKGLASAFKGISGVSKSSTESLTGQFFAMSTGIASGTTTMKKEMNSFGKEMAGFGNDIATATGHKVQEFLGFVVGLALEIDAMRASLNLTTLTMRGYAGMAEEVLKRNIEFGASMEDAGEATYTLSRSVHLAGDASQQYAKDLVDMTVQLKVLGADMGVIGRLQNFYQKGLGKSSEETKDFMRETYKLGKGLRIGVGDAVALLGASFDQLSFRGERWIGISKEVAAMARATGVEMGELLSVAGQFDTFEGAANATAKLNAAIGIMGGTGLLNATALHRMEEQERLKVLHKTFNMQEKSFNQLGPYGKRFLALSMGMKNAGTAAEFFNNSFGDYETHLENIEAATASQQDFEKSLRAAMPMIAELKKAFLEMAIKFTPKILELFDWLTDTALPFMESIGFDNLLGITVAVGLLSVLGPMAIAVLPLIAKALVATAPAWLTWVVGGGLVSLLTGAGGLAAKAVADDATSATRGPETFHSGGSVLKGGHAILQTGEEVVASGKANLIRALAQGQNTAAGAPSAISLEGATLVVNITGAQKDKIYAQVVKGFFDNQRIGG